MFMRHACLTKLLAVGDPWAASPKFSLLPFHYRRRKSRERERGREKKKEKKKRREINGKSMKHVWSLSLVFHASSPSPSTQMGFYISLEGKIIFSWKTWPFSSWFSVKPVSHSQEETKIKWYLLNICMKKKTILKIS